jgi:isopenicillin N synthase-like dioxygenase
LINEQQGNVPLFDKDTDKGLLTLLKLNKFGFQIQNLQGWWIVVDVDLGPQNMVLYLRLFFYQTINGYFSFVVHRTYNSTNYNVIIVVRQGQGLSVVPYRCCFALFKFM